MKHFEVTYIRSLETTCDGGGGPSGHPKVYLHIDEDESRVVCPYCSRTFVLVQQPDHPAASH
jgi:uncharacterized Zn-finger protein